MPSGAGTAGFKKSVPIDPLPDREEVFFFPIRVRPVCRDALDFRIQGSRCEDGAKRPT